MSGISGSTTARVGDEFPEPGYVHRLRRVDPPADAAGRAVAPSVAGDQVDSPFRIHGADVRTAFKTGFGFREFDPFHRLTRDSRIARIRTSRERRGTAGCEPNNMTTSRYLETSPSFMKHTQVHAGLPWNPVSRQIGACFSGPFPRRPARTRIAGRLPRFKSYSKGRPTPGYVPNKKGR